MATIFSTELIHYFSPIFIWIFIFAILYAVLQKFEAFGKNHSLNVSIAFAGSLLFILVPVMRDFVRELVPAFVVLILAIAVIFMILMFVGYKQTDIVTYMQENSYGTVIVTIVVLIFILALGKAVGPVFSQYPDPNEAGIVADFKRVILNPKVLATFVILIIAAFFMKAIAMPSKK